MCGSLEHVYSAAMRRSILAVVFTCALVPALARAEDGYDLWLRYAPIENVALRDTYRQAIAGVIVQQSPATGAIVSQELARGLTGLLGAAVPSRTAVDRDGVLVVGTVASPIVATLGWRDELINLCDRIEAHEGRTGAAPVTLKRATVASVEERKRGGLRIT